MKTSFIILDRKILDWQWYQNPRIFRVFLHCLLKANWKDKKWMGKEIKRGSFVTSQLKLSKELGLDRSAIQRSLKALESEQCLVSKTSNKFTTITICNYDSYQSIKNVDEHQMSTKRASNEHQMSTTNNNNNKNKENNIYIYSEEYFKNAKLVKGVLENQRITESKLRSEMQEFIINLENKGAYSNDFTHFKQHFFSFLKKRNTKGLKEGFVRYIDDRVI